MAARENQGLQIALIIFVMLTIVLIVTTFMFFSSYQEAQEKIKSLTSENTKRRKRRAKAIDESTKLKGLVDTKLEQARGRARKPPRRTSQTHGKGLAEPTRTIATWWNIWPRSWPTANTRITEITAQKKELTDKIAADEAATKDAIAKYTATIATTSKDLEDERQEVRPSSARQIRPAQGRADQEVRRQPQASSTT